MSDRLPELFAFLFGIAVTVTVFWIVGGGC